MLLYAGSSEGDAYSHFSWLLVLMSVEADISSVGGRLFGMLMRASFLSLLLFLDSGRLGKMMGVKVGMEVVVEMVVEVVVNVV